MWEEEQQRKLEEKQTRVEEQVEEEKDKKKQVWLAEGAREVESKLVSEAEPKSPLRAPMKVDEPIDLTESATTKAGEEVYEPELTQDEERDLKTVLQFFLNGGDDGTEPEEAVWAKLEQQVCCTVLLKVDSTHVVYLASTKVSSQLGRIL